MRNNRIPAPRAVAPVPSIPDVRQLAAIWGRQTGQAIVVGNDIEDSPHQVFLNDDRAESAHPGW